jgi:peptide-methionine (R)-S-oxide reductase
MRGPLILLATPVFLGLWLHQAVQDKPRASQEATQARQGQVKVNRTDEEWRRVLSPEQYRVLRRKGTERPFSGEYWNTRDKGSYACAACGQVLFSSATKFDAGCGWPSFWDADPGTVEFHDDYSFGMHRIEVTCARCGGHLGHLFDDGPEPTGKRYCINSVSLKFIPAPATKK